MAMTTATTLLLTACSHGDDTGTGIDDNEIHFSVGTSNMATSSRGTRAATSEAVPNVIGISAYTFSGSFSNTTSVPDLIIKDRSSVNNNIVTTSQIYYWPEENVSVRFYAYGPYSDLNTYASDENIAGPLKIMDYPLAKPDLQNDLLVAQSSDYVSSPGQTVLLPFRHFLTATRFKVAAEDGGTIDSVVISGFYTHGTYTTGVGWDLQSTVYTDPDGLGKDSFVTTTPATASLLMPQEFPENAHFSIYYTNKEGTKHYLINCPLEGMEWKEGIIYVYTINVAEHQMATTLYNWNDGQATDVNAYGDYSTIVQLSTTLYDWNEGDTTEVEVHGNFLYIINLGTDLKDWNEGLSESEQYRELTGGDYPTGLTVGDSIPEWGDGGDTDGINGKRKPGWDPNKGGY